MDEDTSQTRHPDLTAENLQSNVLGIEERWKDLGYSLHLPQEKLKEIEKKKHSPNTAKLEAVFDYMLRLDPYASWRSVILALDKINKPQIAECIRGYAEPVSDSTLTVDSATSVVLATEKDWKVTRGLADCLLIPNSVQGRIKKLRTRNSQLDSLIEYWVNTVPNASWVALVSVLYKLEEKAALVKALAKCKKVKKEGSLTVDNLLAVLEGMTDVGLLEVWFSTPGSREKRVSGSAQERKATLFKHLLSSHPALTWRWVAWVLYTMPGEPSDKALEKIYQKKFLTGDMEDLEENNSPSTVRLVSYCTEAMSKEQTDSPNDVNRPDGAQSAWMQTDKMWGPRDKQLKVHFLNSEVLEDEGWMCGDAPMNVDNVLAWAQQWNSNAFPAIPKFEFSNSRERADIRVHFGGSGCWSAIGTDAKSVKDKTKPTMNLALNDSGLDPDFQKYLVIHEFGHSLGLEHEHQRSDFWKVASKFVDIAKMKADPRLKKVKFDVNMAVLPQGGQRSEYDPDSVMHYWFDVNWLEDENHRTLERVKGDNKLTEEDKKILEGIHKRNKSFRVDGPSKIDLEFLQKCYDPKASTTTSVSVGRSDEEEPLVEHNTAPATVQSVDLDSSEFSVDMTIEMLCDWLKKNKLQDKSIALLRAQDINGVSFVKLPRDRLRTEFPGLTIGGADSVSTLIGKAASTIDDKKNRELHVPQYDFKKLRNALWDVRPEWHSLGVELDIDEGTRAAIKKVHPTDVGEAFTELLSAWSKLSPPRSLDTIITALESKAIGRSDIAGNLKSMLDKGELS